ncbi:MAG TPA: HNH endonuclease signature motif containing protein [Candidatus Paceibacterota bacterium]|nr:HNH endonuclease signature motif containing protein [Candidatus Paceibacterota bacterium]
MSLSPCDRISSWISYKLIKEMKLLGRDKKKWTRFYYDVYIKSTYWQEIRSILIEEVEYKCEDCGKLKEEKYLLQCHHITYENLGRELRKDLVVLCKECHRLRHPEKEKTFEEELNGGEWSVLGESILRGKGEKTSWKESKKKEKECREKWKRLNEERERREQEYRALEAGKTIEEIIEEDNEKKEKIKREAKEKAEKIKREIEEEIALCASLREEKMRTDKAFREEYKDLHSFKVSCEADFPTKSEYLRYCIREQVKKNIETMSEYLRDCDKIKNANK